MSWKSIRRWVWSVAGIYVCLNIALFVINPYASPWHYLDHDPVPLEVTTPDDRALSLSEITKILDEIDLAYGAREPTRMEQVERKRLQLMGLVFLPSTMALHIKEFMGYLGPPSDAQQAFTMSVKARYNALVKLAIEKGSGADRYYYVIEPSLSKKNGAAVGAPGAGPIAPENVERSKQSQAAEGSDLRVTALRSEQGQTETTLTFVNQSQDSVDIFWKDYQGQEVFYRSLQSGKSHRQETFATHHWIVRADTGNDIFTAVATDSPQTVTIPFQHSPQQSD